MKKKTNTLFIVVVIAAVLFTIWIPNKKKGYGYRVVETPVLEEMTAYMETEYQSPVDFITSLFSSYNILFLGEVSMIHQHAEFVAQLIPELDKSGIRILGTEYALYEDQSLIDDVITADTYDESKVHQILFNQMTIWGYQEYADIFRAAWEVNRNKSADEEPFRIIGLNVRMNWWYIEKQKDTSDPEIMAKVMSKGVPDMYMAEVIKKEILSKKEKALIQTGSQHSFTQFRVKQYEESAIEKGISDPRRAGGIIEDIAPSTTGTILIHAPWSKERATYGYDYPVRGSLDELLDELPEEKRAFGVSTDAGVFGTLPVINKTYTYGYENLTLGDMCDGYIVLGPLSDYTGVTAIPDFINEDNREEAIRNFPGPNPGETLTAADLNGFISNTGESIVRIIEKL